MWKVVTSGCQKFYDHWRGNFNKSEFLQQFPYPLSLEIDRTEDGAFIPLPLPTESGSQILVTESYEKNVPSPVAYPQSERGSRKGAVITGQPEIGVSLAGFTLHALIH